MSRWITMFFVLLIACGPSESPEVEPPTSAPAAQVTPAAPAPLTAEQVVELATRLQGEWRVLLSDQERSQRDHALAELSKLGESADVRAVRDAVRKAASMGMTVTDEAMVLHLVAEDVHLKWTLVQDKPHVFAIETRDAMGGMQVWDVTWDGPDIVTLSARTGENVSRFERVVR